MKLWILIFISLLLKCVNLYGQSNLCVTSSMTRLYCQNDFTRISEYITGCENTGGACILRTDECCRAGIYVLLKLNKPLNRLGDDAILRFGYVLSNSAKTCYKEFPIPKNKRFARWVYVGVTGQDWMGCNPILVAWSVEMSGSMTCTKKNSYLWKMGG